MTSPGTATCVECGKPATSMVNLDALSGLKYGDRFQYRCQEHGGFSVCTAPEHAELKAELERLRQRVASLRRAIAHEHQRSNGSSVHMQEPPQHERSRLTCKHPLCAALVQAEQTDA